MDKRKKIVSFIIVLIVIVILGFSSRVLFDNDYSVDVNTNPDVTNVDRSHPTLPSTVTVDVKGAVNRPGVYTLDYGMRVIDAITYAGGYKDNADTDEINSAQMLYDGMMITVPELDNDDISQVCEDILNTDIN